MSLKVWLPLNGDFENYGCSAGLNFTTTGTVSDAEGKIGKSKEFSSSNVISPYNFTLGTEASICCWIYYTAFPSTSSNDWICEIASTSNYANGVLGLSTYHKNYLTIIVGGQYDSSYAHGFSLNTWYHIGFTWDNTIGKLYVNGELVNTYSNLNNGTKKTGNKISLGSNVANSSTKLKGRLNDVRFYDHCLSQKEIKEISQGLVLHYKLDDLVEVNEFRSGGVIANQFEDSIIQDSSGYGNTGTIVGSLEIMNSAIPRYNTTISVPTGSYIKKTDFNFSSADWTISTWFKKTSATTSNFESIIAFSRSDGSDANKKFSLYIKNNAVGCVTEGIAHSSIATIDKTLWHHVCVTNNSGTQKYYLDGNLINSYTNSSNLTNCTDFVIGARSANTGVSSIAVPFGGGISDVRLYATALLDDDVKKLYNTSMSIDDKYNIHAYEIIENYTEELINGKPLLSPYNTHGMNPLTNYYETYNADNEIILTANGQSLGSNYIPINPIDATYYYDYTISVNAGNQFYIGFERYDSNFTSRSNNACVYTTSIKPSTDIVKQRYFGTVNLSTDGTNPCAYIALRILNGWSGTTSGVTGQATIHNFSLRQVYSLQTPKIMQQGVLIADEYKEDSKASFYKNGICEAKEFIER